jgi:threonyl-tRNA synthetase
MYAPMEMDGDDFYAKPMNCPFHIMIYRNARRSYRELPMRLAELGTVYRYERSGTMHGLLRVRGFTQDDAHIFCTPEQVESEIVEVVRFSVEMLRTFGFEDFTAFLSTRPEKAVGEPADWKVAEAALRRALAEAGLEYEVDEGGGAFYGPKIDLKVVDALGREWQLTTVQFDFNMGTRFGLTYIGEDGAEHSPYMVHRALLGSLERFFAVLIEHYGGAFPLWLAPVQARLIPIADRHVEYAEGVAATLRTAGLRADVDVRGERMNAKIRDAQLEKVPYMLVVGDREAEAEAVAVRRRDGEDLGALPVEDLKSRLLEEMRSRT